MNKAINPLFNQEGATINDPRLIAIGRIVGYQIEIDIGKTKRANILEAISILKKHLTERSIEIPQEPSASIRQIDPQLTETEKLLKDDYEAFVQGIEINEIPKYEGKSLDEIGNKVIETFNELSFIQNEIDNQILYFNNLKKYYDSL